MKWNNILAGMIGALFIALVLVGITVWLKPFDYQAVYIVNPKVAVVDSLKSDTLTCNQISVLKDMENKGILLTPQEYTSRISDYYNTLITVLVALFVLFTIGTLWGFRFTSRKEIEEAQENIKRDLANELKDSKAFYENIVKDILGRIEDDIVTKEDKNLVDRNLDDISKKQIKMEDDINLLFEMTDSKSEIN